MNSKEIRSILNSPKEPGHEYIARPEDYEKEVINGFSMEVVPYQFPELDRWCPAKMGELTCIIGHTNVGKTTVILWMLSMLAKQGRKIVVYSAENRISNIVIAVYRFVFGLPVDGVYNIVKLKEIRKMFQFIEHKRQFSYKDMLNQATYFLDADFEFDFFFIDPYNALKIDKKSGLNTHDYHYEAIEEMRVFTMNTSKSIFLNCHTVTESQRTKPDKDGHKPVPLDSDVEGGAKFPNKADNTIVVHRQLGSLIDGEKYVTELHIRKVRNQEFGGEPTPYNSPIRIKYRKDRTGYDLEHSYESKVNDYRQIQFEDNPFK